MRDVVDPELGINVVDLGLVYDVHLDGAKATLEMTLTSAACPFTDVIEGAGELPSRGSWHRRWGYRWRLVMERCQSHGGRAPPPWTD